MKSEEIVQQMKVFEEKCKEKYKTAKKLSERWKLLIKKQSIMEGYSPVEKVTCHLWMRTAEHFCPLCSIRLLFIKVNNTYHISKGYKWIEYCDKCGYEYASIRWRSLPDTYDSRPIGRP